ncbi:MAG TPA: type VI secretion protein IcmF/TssM N-terminal domain-containing protein [Pirellulaceae bacterium]|nr:type VI secretion protein IcmF/TssM N-terminal domain-containing protein [Pirellulaceae bacterium]
MADEAAAKKAAPKKDAGKKEKKSAKEGGGGWLARLMALPKMISAAGCASCLTSVFLMLLVIGVWLVFYFEPGNLPWRHAMGFWTRIVPTLLLVVLIPLVLYRAIRLWLQGEQSAHPDIDFAWKAGMEALAQNGLSPGSVPLFLVLGSASVRQEMALVRAAGLSLRVHDVPEGPAPLHWYASPDGIYLVLSEACSLSSLATLLEKRRAQAPSLGESSTPGDLPALPAPGIAAPRPAPKPAPAVKRERPAPGGDRTRGTIMLDQFVSDRQEAEAQAQAAATATEDEAEAAAPAAMTVSDQPAILSQQESARQKSRLEYVCHLIRQARFPICPINGVMVLLPFELLQATQRETQQLQKTVRADLGCLQRELEIRCPVTALIVGMHQERGFRELVRRVGRERATAQRFGRRFDVRIIPTTDNLAALCSLSAGVFEDWIHTLFREAEALTRPGNLRLYGLLCKVRSTLSGVLTEVLVGGFAHDPQNKEVAEPIPFSGCYFAATGETEDQQAFVRGVFEKLVEEQEEIEWTRLAAGDNRLYILVALAAIAATAVCLIVIAVRIGLGVWWSLH